MSLWVSVVIVLVAMIAIYRLLDWWFESTVRRERVEAAAAVAEVAADNLRRMAEASGPDLDRHLAQLDARINEMMDDAEARRPTASARAAGRVLVETEQLVADMARGWLPVDSQGNQWRTVTRTTTTTRPVEEARVAESGKWQTMTRQQHVDALSKSQGQNQALYSAREAVMFLFQENARIKLELEELRKRLDGPEPVRGIRVRETGGDQ